MIRFLSDIKPANTVVIAVILLVFRAFYFLRPDFLSYQPEFGESHVQYIFFLLNRNIWGSFLLSYVLTFTTALTINKIVNDQELLSKKTYLPAYFYCIISSIFPEYIILTPVVFINLLMAFAFQRIFEVYRASWPIDNIFLGGFLVGMSILFSISYIVFFPYLIIGIWVFRPAKLNEFLAALFGVFLPLFIGVILNYLLNNIFISGEISLNRFSLSSSLNYLLFSPMLFSIILFFLSSTKIIGNFWRNNIKNRRILILLYIYTAVTILLTLTGKQNPIYESHFLSIPIALFAAIYFDFENKLTFIKKVLHGLLWLIILVFQYSFLFAKT